MCGFRMNSLKLKLLFFLIGRRDIIISYEFGLKLSMFFANFFFVVYDNITYDKLSYIHNLLIMTIFLQLLCFGNVIVGLPLKVVVMIQ